MKYKNYKSAIHNFAHSFQSIDYSKSGIIAINTLFELVNNDQNPTICFDFIRKSIKPSFVRPEKNKLLLTDYLFWLPQHFSKHNCDLSKIEELTICLKIDMNKITIPKDMGEVKEYKVITKVKWKVKNKYPETYSIETNNIISDAVFAKGIEEIYI